MSEIVLQATTRTITGKQVKALRRAGKIPAVIYGHNLTPLAITLDFKETSRSLLSVSSSQLITVNVDDQPHRILVRERQYHPVTGYLVHVDFQEVSMTEKLRVTVGLVYKGEAPAVKSYNGVVIFRQEELDVECLPQDMPNYIEVDISGLKEVGDVLRVSDVRLSDSIEVLADPDEILVIVTPPISEEEVVGEAGEFAEPEVIEKGKKEEEDY